MNQSNEQDHFSHTSGTSETEKEKRDVQMVTFFGFSPSENLTFLFSYYMKKACIFYWH